MKMTISDLRERFKNSLLQVSQILGIHISQISRDLFKETCYKRGIKYVDPYLIGGYVKSRDELISDKTFDEINITNKSNIQQDIEKCLYNYVKENKFIPVIKEFKNVCAYKIFDYFKDMENLYKETRKQFPDIDNFLFNEDNYTDKYRKELLKELKNHNKFIITSAVCGKQVDDNFFNSLKTYAKKNKALVLVLPIVNNSKNSIRNWDLDPKLKEFKILFEEVSLNKNLRLWDIRINSKQAMSLTGLDRVVSTLNASIIVGSTKQAMKYIPTSKMKVPHMLASTGCCTINDYTTAGLMPNRTTKIAEVMHKLGALVVEVENEKIYHCRNIEAGPSGEIIDLSIQYKPDGKIENVKNTVMVVGDLHVPKHNIPLVNKHIELIPKLNVSTVVLHDTINMGAVSHHNTGKMCLKAMQALKGENTIIGEAVALKGVLEQFCKVTKNVVIPFSNHPAHLNKYLEEARFVEDPINFYISLDLAKIYMDGKNVLQYLMEHKVKLNAKNITWLDEDDSCNIYGVECGCHGDSSINGGKGNPLSYFKAFGKNITAHTHSPSIIDGSFVVGMACEKDQGYNVGLSSWLSASALLYPNGTIQIINFIEVEDDYKCGV